MKLKGFIDLFFLQKKYSLEEILSFFEQKYPYATLFLAFKRVTYFDDADLHDSPKTFSNHTWEEINKEIELQYSKLDF